MRWRSDSFSMETRSVSRDVFTPGNCCTNRSSSAGQPRYALSVPPYIPICDGKICLSLAGSHHCGDSGRHGNADGPLATNILEDATVRFVIRPTAAMIHAAAIEIIYPDIVECVHDMFTHNRM